MSLVCCGCRGVIVDLLAHRRLKGIRDWVFFRGRGERIFGVNEIFLARGEGGSIGLSKGAYALVGSQIPYVSCLLIFVSRNSALAIRRYHNVVYAACWLLLKGIKRPGTPQSPSPSF